MDKPAKPPARQKTKPPARQQAKSLALDAKSEEAKPAPAALSALEVHEIFAKLAAAMPEPKTELSKRNRLRCLSRSCCRRRRRMRA